MTNNLEVALAIKIAQTGLENIDQLIKGLKAAGVETVDFETEAQQLNAVLGQLDDSLNPNKLNQSSEATQQAAVDANALATAVESVRGKLEQQSAALEAAKAATAKSAEQSSQLADSSRQAAKAADSLSTAVKGTSDSVERQAEVLDEAKNAAKAAADQSAKLDGALGAMASAAGQASQSTDKLNTEMDATARLAADRDLLGLKQHIQIQQEIEQTRAAYERLKQSGKLTSAELAQAALKTEDRIKELQHQTNGWTDSLENAKAALAGVGAAGAGLVVIAGQAIEFETAMAGVKKVVDGTPEQIEALGRRIKELATELPIGADGLAQIAAAGGQLGVPIEKLETFIHLSTKMSTAFNLTAEEAGQAVAQLSNVFNRPLESVEALGDAINTLGNTTAAKESQILDFLTRVGGTANQFGLTAEQASALGATLISMGSSSEVAATGVNALLSKLQTANTQSADFQQALKRMGISANELAAEIRANPQQALSEFLAQLDQLDQQAKAEVLSQLFGAEYQDDIARLLSGLNQYDAALKRVSDSGTTAGAMQKEFDTQMATTQAQLDRLKNSVEAIGINIGTALLPVLRPLIAGLGDVAAAIATLVEKNPELAAFATVLGSAALAMSGLKTAGLAINVVLAKVVGGVGDASKGLDGLSSQTGKATGAMRLLGAAIPLAAFYFAYTQIRKLIDTLNEHSAAAAALADVNKKLDESQKALADRFAEISDKTGVTVTNMKELDVALADGRIVADELTASYVSAVEAQRLLADRALSAADAQKELAKRNAETVAAASDQKIHWDVFNQTVETTTKALTDASKGGEDLADTLDARLAEAFKGGPSSLAGFIQALDVVRGKLEQGDQQVTGWIASMNATDLTRFQFALQSAFESGTLSARKLAEYSDLVVSQSLKSLGVDAATALGKVTPATESAIQNLNVLESGLGELGLTAKQQGSVLEQALINAYQNAKSAADKAALDEVMARWEAQGLITADAVKKVKAETSGLGAASDDLARRMKDAGIVTQASMDDIAESARKLYDDIVKAGLPIAEQQQAFMNYAEAAIAANSDISESELRLQAARLGMTEQLDELINKQKQAGDTGKEAGDKTTKGSKEAKDATQDLADSTEKTARDVQGLTDDLGAWFRGVRSEMQALSAEAGAMFDSKLGINSGPILTEVEAIEAGMQNAREQLAGIAKDNLQVFDVTGINRWKNSVLAAKDETILAYGQQKLKFEEYMTALQSGETVNQSLINSARNATVNMNLLGSESLATLRSAISSATAQLQQMSSSATDTLTSLRQELYSLRGETEALQESQYKQRKAELEAALAEAQAAGNKEAIAAYKEALSTLAEIRKEQKAQAKADGNGNSSATAAAASSSSSDSSSSTASTTSKTTASSAATVSIVEVVRIEMGSLSANVIATDKSDILAIIEDAMRRSV